MEFRYLKSLSKYHKTSGGIVAGRITGSWAPPEGLIWNGLGLKQNGMKVVFAFLEEKKKKTGYCNLTADHLAKLTL